MVNTLPERGVLRVVSSAALTEAERAQDEARAASATTMDAAIASNLAAHIRTQYEIFRSHRNSSSGWSERLLAALRTFNGQYDPAKLADIQRFGGTTVYARVIAMKCRGASALLRDVYLGQDRPWGLAPPSDPDVPEDVAAAIQKLVMMEQQTLVQNGAQFDLSAVRDRVNQLMDAAKAAARKQSTKKARAAEDKLDEILTEGGFYKALAELVVDVPLFPYACIKGPTVKIIPGVSWENGQPVPTQKPRLFWQRVSPFDVYWTPGVSDIEDATVIERTRVTRADLNDLLDLPSYDTAAIREVLSQYGRGGLSEDWDMTDSERAVQESRENPLMNQSGMISCLEFHGNVQGSMLRDYGMDEQTVPDPDRDYMVQAWLIGTHVIKAQLSPSPRKRHPYFITSFEKVPGTPVGNGLPDILADIGDVCNASIRALVNNLSISSGPQVVVNDDRLAPQEDGEDMYPWKRWHVTSDGMSNSAEKPIDFFQPRSNAQELIGVYQRFNEMADELSAIPRFLSGANPGGGAGRTASGLAMLMGNAAKILQTVAANIDRDIMSPAMAGLYDTVMLTDDSGTLSGDESIRVLGVNVAVQRETQRQRQLEFLQVTANPIDMQIVGPKGRAAVLRSVANTIGLDGEAIVPTEDQIEQAAQVTAQQAAQAQGAQPPAPSKDMGPRVNTQPRLSGGA